MRNIHSIVNANGLMKKWINAIPGKENEGLIDVYKARIAFGKHIREDASNQEKIEKALKFIHRGNLFSNTYRDEEFKGDTSHFSAQEVSKNVANGAEETGNCLGTSQIGGYLLLTEKIPTKIGITKDHIFLYTTIENKDIPIETTSKLGYNYADEENSKKLEIEKLEAIVLSNVGASWYEKGEYDKAIKDYTKAIKLNPKYEDAFYNRGISWHEKGEYDKAIKDYTKAIKLNPKYEDAFHNRGISWNDKEEYDKAIKDYTKAIKLNPKYESAFHNRGNSWSRIGEYDNAITDYTKVIKLNPKCESAFYNRGISWNNKEEYDKALEDFQKYALLSGDNDIKVIGIIEYLKNKVLGEVQNA